MMSRKGVIGIGIAILIYSILIGIISVFSFGYGLSMHVYSPGKTISGIADLFFTMSFPAMSICGFLGFLFSIIGSIKLFSNNTKDLRLSFWGIWGFIVCGLIAFLVTLTIKWICYNNFIGGDAIFYYIVIAIIIVPGSFIIKGLKKIQG